MTAVSATTMSAARRTSGSRKSITGQSAAACGLRASLRRCSHMPNGMSSRPIRNAAGRATKTTRPAYGFANSPARTAIVRAMNTTAETVVRIAPAIATG